ncbi:MAG: redoxin domain-containing protein [Sedimentisphaerales bacterium]|nr:redoxin domain-containing protein [Sedimentisphaerales bacterium]
MTYMKPRYGQFAGTLLLALAALGSRTSMGEIQGDIQLLKTIADDYEASLAQLRTWRGRASIRSHTTEGNGPARVARYQANFLVDRDREASKWMWFTLTKKEQASPSETPSDLNPKARMSRGDCDYLVFYYDYGLPGEERSVKIHAKDTLARHFQQNAFDFLRVLTEEIHPDVARELRSYHKHNTRDTSSGRITREGSLVTIESNYQYESVGEIVVRCTLDLSKGCCPTEFLNSSRASTTHWRLTYEQIAGVFVPKSISLISVNKNHDPLITGERTAVLTSTMVNESVDEAEFSLGGLGVKAGDPVGDMRTGRHCRFGEKGATEADLAPRLTRPIINTPLPSLDGIEIDLSEQGTKDRIVLVCFFDMNQRPARRCVLQLAEQAKRLREKGVQIIAIQASKADPNDLATWTAEQKIPFPTGRIADHIQHTQATWGVRSLPWLILTDRKHIVGAEGFGLNEMETKLAKISDVQR